MENVNPKLFSQLKYFCIFIGYPRSGHSIVGSIIDAHENACVSHEFNALQLYPLFKNKEAFFNKISEVSLSQFKQDRKSNKYSYKFENLHQGSYNHLKVIGDKKGSGTTNLLIEDADLLNKFQDFVEIPLKIIHITRNPYDIITTKASYTDIAPSLLDQIKSYFSKSKMDDHIGKAKRKLVKTDITSSRINASIHTIIHEAKTNQEFINSNKYDILTLKHEDLIKNNQEFISSLFNFLELGIDEHFITTIQTHLFKKENQSRLLYNWNDAEKNLVLNEIISLPSFKGYSFEN